MNLWRRRRGSGRKWRIGRRSGKERGSATTYVCSGRSLRVLPPVAGFLGLSTTLSIRTNEGPHRPSCRPWLGSFAYRSASAEQKSQSTWGGRPVNLGGLPLPSSDDVDVDIRRPSG